jgi:hypothetical protein
MTATDTVGKLHQLRDDFLLLKLVWLHRDHVADSFVKRMDLLWGEIHRDSAE